VTRVYLELGAKKIFACALDWPGWARSGRTEELALSALDEYRDRFAEVCSAAGLALPEQADFVVVERVKGDASTDFGVPGKVAATDGDAVPAAEAKRQAALVRAAWDVFDATVAGTPESLRKGPRGGGRDRDKMVDHVLGAEASYGRMIGVRHKQPAYEDKDAVEALRADLLAVLTQASDGSPLRAKGWPARYAARRIAWHVLDHVWEMVDRTD
jgi:hypothetical protein